MEQRHLEILLEDMRGKFELVLEGHQVLRSEIQQSRAESKERDDHLLFLIRTLNGKIDAVGADLAAHRRDTEAHPGVYSVREGES